MTTDFGQEVEIMSILPMRNPRSNGRSFYQFLFDFDEVLHRGNSVSAFRVKFGANDLNCVDVLLNPTHSRTEVGA